MPFDTCLHQTIMTPSTDRDQQTFLVRTTHATATNYATRNPPPRRRRSTRSLVDRRSDFYNWQFVRSQLAPSAVDPFESFSSRRTCCPFSEREPLPRESVRPFPGVLLAREGRARGAAIAAPQRMGPMRSGTPTQQYAHNHARPVRRRRQKILPWALRPARALAKTTSCKPGPYCCCENGEHR
jgi:hypothetical protein